MSVAPDRHIVIPYAPRHWATLFHASQKRFAVLVMHRRCGKSTAIINHHQRQAMNGDLERQRLIALVPTLTTDEMEALLHPPGGRFYGHILPTYKQAKLAMWDQLKYYADPIPGRKFNETELSVRYPSGHQLRLFGADEPDSLRGPGFAGLSFDEYGHQPANIFSEVLSKSLADHLGYAIFAGTLKGKNHLFQTYEVGKKHPEWFALWQDVDVSLETEEDAATTLLRRAMCDDRELVVQGLMSQEEFDQEWYLSTDAAIKGAFYAHELAAAKAERRITIVPYDPILPVDTDWDLGVDDATAIWFSQSLRSGEVRLIDYYENTGEGLPHYAQTLRSKPYTYGVHWAPHDIQVRELGSGRSRLETAATLGIKFEVVPQLAVVEGIHAVRMLLPRCWFDAEKCARGLEALRHYRKRLNAVLNEFTGTPVHDLHSHGADSFRGLAVRHKTPMPKKTPSERRVVIDEGSVNLSWMS